MLVTAERFIGVPVMSLQTGAELARTSRAVIDPRSLSIVAYELEGRLLDQQPSLLRIADIREISSFGMIIDSADELVGVQDVIKLKEVYEFQFELVGKPVFDEAKHKVGKTIGYTLEAGNFVIQQLRVHRPFLKSFGDTEILIHRSQIKLVTDEHIVVKSTKTPQRVAAPAQRSLGYTNPFRKPAEVQQSE